MHIIRRQTLQIDLKASRQKAFEIQAMIQKVYEEDLLPLISERLDALTQKGETVYIPRLVLDLGDVNFDNLQASLKQSFEKAWDKWLKELPFSSPKMARELGLTPQNTSATVRPEDIISKMHPTAVRRLSQAERMLRSLSFFLKNGRLPWWEDADDEETLTTNTSTSSSTSNNTSGDSSAFDRLLNNLMQLAPKTLVESLAQIISQSPSTLQRLLWQSTTATKLQLITLLWSKLDKATTQALIELLREGGTSRANAEQLLSEVLISTYYQQSSNNTDINAAFWQTLESNLNKRQTLSARQREQLSNLAEGRAYSTTTNRDKKAMQHAALIANEAPLAYNTEIDILRYFLQKGSLPSWADLPNAQAFELWLSELIRVEPDAILSLLSRLSKSSEGEVAFRRLATRLNDEQFEELSALLLPKAWLPIYTFLWQTLVPRQNLAGRTTVAVRIKTFILHIRYWQNLNPSEALRTDADGFMAQLSQFLSTTTALSEERWVSYLKAFEPSLVEFIKQVDSDPLPVEIQDSTPLDSPLDTNPTPEDTILSDTNTSPAFDSKQDAQAAVWLAWAQTNSLPWWTSDALEEVVPMSFSDWTASLLKQSPTLLREALRLSTNQRRKRILQNLERQLSPTLLAELVNSLQPATGGFALILRELSLQTAQHLALSFDTWISPSERQSWQVLLEVLAQDNIADNDSTTVSELALQAIRLSAKRYQLAPEAVLRLWTRLAQDLEDDFPRLAAVADVLDKLLRRPIETFSEDERVITPLSTEDLPDTDIEKQALSTWRNFLQQTTSPDAQDKRALIEAFRQLAIRRVAVLRNLFQTNLVRRTARQQLLEHFPDLIPAVLSVVQNTPFANLSTALNDAERFLASVSPAPANLVQSQFYDIVLLEAVAGQTRQLNMTLLAERLLVRFNMDYPFAPSFWAMDLNDMPSVFHKAFEGLKTLQTLKSTPQDNTTLSFEDEAEQYLEQYRLEKDTTSNETIQTQLAKELSTQDEEANLDATNNTVESDNKVVTANPVNTVAPDTTNKTEDTKLTEQDATAPNTETEQQKQARLRRLAFSTLKNTNAKAKPQSTKDNKKADKKGPKKPTEEVYFINNAGLVILHPFLPQFFKVLNIDLKNPEQALRAVHLLQYIVTKRTHTPEEELTLNKLLCGVPLSSPVPAGLDDMTEQERQTADMIIKAATGNWTAMKNTSVDNFRVTFLQRGGRITETSEAFVLRVNSSPLDLLLQTMPWAMGILRYSWMPKMVTVEWATG